MRLTKSTRYLYAVAALALPVLALAQSVPPPSAPPPATAPSSPLTPAQQFQQLHWIIGPTTVAIGGNARLVLPKFYSMLAPPDSLTFLHLNGNVTDAGDNADYIFGKHHGNWFGLLRYNDEGHIPDNQTIDAAQLLSTVQANATAENTERQKLGYPTTPA